MEFLAKTISVFQEVIFCLSALSNGEKCGWMGRLMWKLQALGSCNYLLHSSKLCSAGSLVTLAISGRKLLSTQFPVLLLLFFYPSCSSPVVHTFRTKVKILQVFYNDSPPSVAKQPLLKLTCLKKQANKLKNPWRPHQLWSGRKV